ncbi:MAG: hypothetical protein WBM40_15690, partial [Thiohalocapsa sp.]
MNWSRHGLPASHPLPHDGGGLVLAVLAAVDGLAESDAEPVAEATFEQPPSPGARSGSPADAGQLDVPAGLG